VRGAAPEEVNPMATWTLPMEDGCRCETYTSEALA
jgi:hypothetical protein